MSARSHVSVIRSRLVGRARLTSQWARRSNSVIVLLNIVLVVVRNSIVIAKGLFRHQIWPVGLYGRNCLAEARIIGGSRICAPRPPRNRRTLLPGVHHPSKHRRTRCRSAVSRVYGFGSILFAIVPVWITQWAAVQRIAGYAVIVVLHARAQGGAVRI